MIITTNTLIILTSETVIQAIQKQMTGVLKWKSKEMEEFRRKVIEAKIRLVLGLKPEEDIRKAAHISFQYEFHW